VNCLEQVFYANHAANKLVSHIVREKGVGLKPARLIIEDNLYTFYHVEP
jgi:hypothetical protein